VALPGSTATYIYLGPRVIRGWAIKLVLIMALLPFLLAAVDLFARCRRRRIPLAPALRSYRSRLGFWLWVGAVFGVLALLGAWGKGESVPPSPDTRFTAGWPPPPPAVRYCRGAEWGARRGSRARQPHCSCSAWSLCSSSPPIPSP